MKKILLIFTFLLTITAAFSAEPEDFIPQRSTQIARINAAQVLKTPTLQTLLNLGDEKCREVFLLLEELKKHNITPSSLFAGELWSAGIGDADNSYVILFKTALPEVKFAEFFNTQKKQNNYVDLHVSSLAGKTIYTAKYAASYNAASRKVFFAVYLAKDVIAFMPLTDKAEALLAELQESSGSKLAESLDRKSLCAVCHRSVKRKEKLRSVKAKIDLTGKEKQDIQVDIVLQFKNTRTALRKAMEIQLLIPSIAGLFLSDAPELLQSFLNHLEIYPEKEKLLIKLNLSKDLQDKAAVYLSQPDNAKKWQNISPADNM